MDIVDQLRAAKTVNELQQLRDAAVSEIRSASHDDPHPLQQHHVRAYRWNGTLDIESAYQARLHELKNG